MTFETPARDTAPDARGGRLGREVPGRVREEGRRAPGDASAPRPSNGPRAVLRERVRRLLDEGSFVEFGASDDVRDDACPAEDRPGLLPAVVTGHGTIDGRRVCVYACSVPGCPHRTDEAAGARILRLMDFALSTASPVIAVDGSETACRCAAVSVPQAAALARRHALASGFVPQIAVRLGRPGAPGAGGPLLVDFLVTVGVPHRIHHLANVSGRPPEPSHHIARDDREAFDFVRDLLSYLPANAMTAPPAYSPPDDADNADLAGLDTVLPEGSEQPYDMYDLLAGVVDYGELLPLQPLLAPGVICALGRVDGRSVGVVAGQPAGSGGALTRDAEEKAARFVGMCDTFGVPVLTFVDALGHRPSTGPDGRCHGFAGSVLVRAYTEATVPTVTVVVRGAPGREYWPMGSKQLGVDVNPALPTVRIRSGGEDRADGGTDGGTDGAGGPKGCCGPRTAPERGDVDAVILPSETREHLRRTLAALRAKRLPGPPGRPVPVIWQEPGHGG